MNDFGPLAPSARRITWTLFTGQSVASAGLIASFTVMAIAGAELSGAALLAGLPATVHMLGKAFSAYFWGYAFDRIGRRAGLTAGEILGAAGSVLSGAAIVNRSFGLFLFGLVLMGSARGALDLGRFFAAEVHPPSDRGRAVSRVVIGGTIGAVLGPLLTGPSGIFALRLQLPELSGAYWAAGILFVITAAITFVFLRPDPRDLGQRVAELFPETERSGDRARSLNQILTQPTVLVAVTAMVFSQVVMVMLMVITSLHMTDHNHGLTSISVVLASHTLGMYAFSLVTGWLVDRWGRGPVIVSGALVLILASLIAPISPGIFPLSVSLFLLGLGWNFCYVGGSTLLSDELSAAERSRTQGFNDLLIGLVSAGGSLGSGVVYATSGYALMGLVSAALALLPLVLTIRWQRRRRPAEAAV